MKTILLICAIVFLSFPAQATQLAFKELSELVNEAENILTVKIAKVEMVDAKGAEIDYPEAQTGPGLGNELRLHVLVDQNNIIKSSQKIIPHELVIHLWKEWHYTLSQWKEKEGEIYIFLLNDNFQPVYPSRFMRDLSEKPQIENLLEK